LNVKVNIGFEDFWHAKTTKAIRENPIYQLLSKRFDLHLCRHPDFLVYSCFGRRFLKYDCTRIFYTGENVRPNFSQCDYAFSFDYPVTEKNFRLPLYKFYDQFDKVKDRGKNLSDPTSLQFCNFLYSNKKAPERIDFFKRLQKYKNIDSGGKVFNNMGGCVTDKMAFLRGYKFTIAFENACCPGYTTEKILEALIANTIPIYWGNPLVSRDFNPDCFINCHDFNDFDAVIERVIEVDQDNDLYGQYISAPAFRKNVESEFANEDKILDRFELIFSGRKSSKVATKADRLKYYFHLLNIPNAIRKLVRWQRR